MNDLKRPIYRKSDHFDGKHFFNPNGKGKKTFADLLKWKLNSQKGFWPNEAINKGTPYLAGSGTLGTGEYAVTFINHATVLVQVEQINILTDPVYSERVSPFTWAGPKRVRPPGVPFEELPEIHIVLVSHDHYDHLDELTLKRLHIKFNPLFVVPLGNKELLEGYGIKNVIEMDWWENYLYQRNGVLCSLTFTPAQHWSGRWPHDRFKRLWGGFFIQVSEKKYFFAGDTGFGPHFLEIQRRLGETDLALLPIGAYAPRWIMEENHMDPEDALKAHQDLGSKKSIGIHFGTFCLSDDGMDAPKVLLREVAQRMDISDKDFITLEEGETLRTTRTPQGST